MTHITVLLDNAGASLHEGISTEYLGRRGAAIFWIGLGTLFPVGSVGNFFWVGLLWAYGLLTGQVESAAWHPWAIAGCLIVGAVGAYFDLREMAKRPAIVSKH